MIFPLPSTLGLLVMPFFFDLDTYLAEVIGTLHEAALVSLLVILPVAEEALSWLSHF